MAKPFVPHKPEKMVTLEITAKEAHLINCLRMLEFGKGVVHKASGVLVRFETTESILLTDDDDNFKDIK